MPRESGLSRDWSDAGIVGQVRLELHGACFGPTSGCASTRPAGSPGPPTRASCQRRSPEARGRTARAPRRHRPDPRRARGSAARGWGGHVDRRRQRHALGCWRSGRGVGCSVVEPGLQLGAGRGRVRPGDRRVDRSDARRGGARLGSAAGCGPDREAHPGWRSASAAEGRYDAAPEVRPWWSTS
jgi:hypothetical protein